MSPEQLRQELEWERKSKQMSRTIARCTGCGLGYISLREAGVSCMRCGEAVMYWTYKNGGQFLQEPELGKKDRATYTTWQQS